MFEGTAPNRTAKQEPRTKIQQNKWHFFHAPQVKGFICGVHVLFLHFTTFAWFRRVNNLHLLLFYLQYPPTCLPCLLHPPGSNYICNFSIFSIPHLFACFTTHTGSELHVAACVTFQLSGSHVCKVFIRKFLLKIFPSVFRMSGQNFPVGFQDVTS